MSRGEDGFLGRWSRRKRTAEQAEAEEREAEARDAEARAVPEAEAEPPAEEAEAQAEASPGLTEEELAALPRIEDLTPGSDIKAFLRVGVPRELRNAALRRMWLLTPAIRDYKNPAVDYAWDWNTPGGVPGDGCAPSPERMAQMLRDLVAPRSPEPATEPADESSEAPAEPQIAALEPETAAQGQEDAVDDAGAPASEVAFREVPRQAASEPQPERDIVPRRHGGALPL